MENKLEELLNSLIEKWWKPRWEKVNKVIKTWIDEFGDGYVLFDWELNWYKQRWCNMVELVSKSSWLWQFVCENGIVNVPHPNKWKYPRDKLEREQYKYWDRTIWYYWEDNLDRIWYNWDKYQFRLIESSLKDESELEDFLLNSIVINND